MRSLLGTRGKTQGRVYHSIKEQGERLRALYQKSAVSHPSTLFSFTTLPTRFSWCPLARDIPGWTDRPPPVCALATCEAASTRCGYFTVRLSDKASETRGETGKWGETLDSHTYLNWRFFSKLKKGSQLFPGSLRRFLFLNWLNWQRRSCSLSSGSGANKSFSYFL